MGDGEGCIKEVQISKHYCYARREQLYKFKDFRCACRILVMQIWPVNWSVETLN